MKKTFGAAALTAATAAALFSPGLVAPASAAPSSCVVEKTNANKTGGARCLVGSGEYRSVVRCSDGVTGYGPWWTVANGWVSYYTGANGTVVSVAAGVR